MESPLSLCRMHWDHEPKTRKWLEINGSFFGSWESRLSLLRMHRDHEPELAKSARQRFGLRQSSGALLKADAKAPEDWRSPKPAVRFMESPFDREIVHRDLEPRRDAGPAEAGTPNLP